MSDLLVNDLHSELNPTRIARLFQPAGTGALVDLVGSARASGAQLAICGGRHAMGGQQFATDQWLVDMRRHAAIRSFDPERGLITVEAGIQWPELIAGYSALQQTPGWGIRQKQTGADRLTLGGALAANIHGRGLRMGPIIADVEAFTLVDAAGNVQRCSRSENRELFGLVIGGYGLFGLVAEITLRLMPRVVVQRRVEVLTLDQLVRVPQERDTSEWLFGDFQYSIDERSPDFLCRGVFSAYQRVEAQPPVGAVDPGTRPQRGLRIADWERLLHLAHTDRGRGFEEYAAYYRSTDGQRYWSDTHQLGTYVDGYHNALDQCLSPGQKRSEMISEIYVPRLALAQFMEGAAAFLRECGVPVIYGTIRLIERDEESFLAWAREPWACIIFNLCVGHTPAGLEAAQSAFGGLIDLAIAFGGSYYLTYHRWANRAQIEQCHPRFADFLARKQAHDPDARFTSDWYRHSRDLFA